MVNDSFEVVDRIRKLNTKDTLLSTFYIKKLFTDVLLDLILQISTYMLCSLEKPNIKKHSFVTLLKIATGEFQFSFNNIVLPNRWF